MSGLVSFVGPAAGSMWAEQTVLCGLIERRSATLMCLEPAITSLGPPTCPLLPLLTVPIHTLAATDIGTKYVPI